MLEELAALGLAGEVTPQQVKRAYLRKVKEHPPERDPEGFQRVRRAYEQAMGQLQLRALRAGEEAARSVTTPSASPESPVATTVSPDEPAAGQPAPAGQPIAAAEPSPAADPLLADSKSTAAPAPATKVEPAERFPDYVAQQIGLLNRALADEDPKAAASAMIELYLRPPLEEAPVPPAIFTLRTFMVLMEAEQTVLARRLLDAFEDHAAKHQSALGVGGEISARWRLAQEVLGVSELDARLAAVLAVCLRRGRLFEAANEARLSRIRNPRSFEKHLRAKAPTLWNSIETMVRPPQEVTPPVRSWSWGGGSWAIGAVLIALLRVCASSQMSPHRVSDSLAPTVVVERHNPPEPPPGAEPLPTGSVPSPLPWETADHQHAAAAPEVKRDGSWMAISLSLAGGDCEGVRAQWPLYRASLLNSHVDEALERSRRAEVLQMCAELKNVVEPEE